MNSNTILIKMQRLQLSLLPVVLSSSLVALIGANLASSMVTADDSVIDEIRIAVPVACTMNGTGQNSHNTNINNGTYTPDIGSTTLHALCNDNEGFAIYAAGYTGDEVGGTNSNKLVGTNASGNATIESGTATTAGTPDTSNWAMKLAITGDSGDTTGTNAFTIDSAPNVALPSEAEQGATSASFSSYHVVPNEYVKVAHKNSNTDMSETIGGVKLTTTYAAYISKTQAADAYSGQVIYTLVHPASAAPKVPVSCNPTGTTIGTNSGTDIKCMQDFANMTNNQRNAIIESMTNETQYTLVDKRDEKTYTIAKYATKYYDEATDSEIPSYDIWMTKNLDLDIDKNTTYTNEDTDIGYNITTNSYDTASWVPNYSTHQPTPTHILEWCQGGTWVEESWGGHCHNDSPESYDPGDLYWNQTESNYDDWEEYYNSCDYSAPTPVCDQSWNPISTYVSTTGVAQYHLGNYYNWPAAVATNDSSVYVDEDYTYDIVVEQSICPAGWTLPRYDGKHNFYSLWRQYDFVGRSFDDQDEDHIRDTNEDALWTEPLYFAVGGNYGGVLDDVGFSGAFWTPVPNDSDSASGVYFSVSGYASQVGGGSTRSTGRPVRCILRRVFD